MWSVWRQSAGLWALGREVLFGLWVDPLQLLPAECLRNMARECRMLRTWRSGVGQGRLGLGWSGCY